MIAMKNILIYFDYPITSIQGGTEQASFLLARLLVRQGFRIIFLSLHPFKEKIMNSRNTPCRIPNTCSADAMPILQKNFAMNKISILF